MLHPIHFLLLFVPLSIIGKLFHFNDGLVFVFTCLGIVPLSKLIGDATEQISLYTGPKIGGMLNATMGNVPELLIGIFAVKAGLFTLVLASMAGSVMGNLMLVLGFSIFLAGKTNWLEGLLLIGTYALFGIAFFNVV